MSGGRIEIEVVPDARQFPGKLSSALKPATGLASTLGKGIGLAIVGGTAVAAVGLKNVIELGNEYTSSLNELQAVSGATGLEMTRVGDAARALGSDLALPATSGADAAKVMLELAKGGLTLDESMQAARGTIQLAAAAQIEGAAAAEIQSGALNQFGLAADQASRVADVLANTSNAASGSITDIALALKYVGPVAASAGISIEDTATTIGLLANQGIQADNAGTALRGMIASLAAPSKEAAGALSDLQVQAFDSQGKFVGLRTVIEQLTAAQGRMTDEQFTAAAATAFGREPLAAITALAAGGAVEFDKMAVSVAKQGGAADVAAAKTAGLGGAMDKLKSQAEDVGLGIYDAIAPHLERLVLAGAQYVSEFGDELVNGLDTTIAAAEVYGPRLAEALSSRGEVVGKAVEDIFRPIAEGSLNPLNEAVNTGIGAWNNLTGAMDNAVTAAKPVAEGVGNLAQASAEGSGSVNALAAGLGLAGDALEGASAILVPVGQLLGTVVSGFAALPGPVQSAVTALVAFRIARSALGDTKAFSGIRQFSDEMRVQRSLAAANGEQITRLGSAMAAYRTSTVGAVTASRGFTDQTAAIRAGAAATGQSIGLMSAAMGTLTERSPGLSALRASFDNAAGGATRFGAAAGIAAASGTGLRLAAGGLMAAMGGPFGVAIAGAAVGLSILANNQQEAAQKAREHEQSVAGLQGSLDSVTGAITRQTLESQAQKNASDGTADAARRQKIALEDLLDAQTGNGSKLAEVNAQLRQNASEWLNNSVHIGRYADDLRLVGLSASDFTEVAVGNQDALKRVQAAIASIPDASNPTRQALELLLAQVQNGAGDFSKLGGAIGSANGDLTEAQKRHRDTAEAIKNGTASMLKGTDSGRSLAAAMKTLSDNTASVDGRARALKDALDALSGGSVNLEAANARLNEQLSRLRDAFGENVDQTKGFGEALLNVDGSINTTVANGRTLFDALQDISGSTAEVAQKTYDLAISQGATVPEAMAKATAAAQSSRDAFIANAAQMGLNADQAALLADRYGLVPADVATLIKAPGMSETQQELIVLKALADRVPDDKPIHVQSLSDEAQAKLEAVGITVERIKDSKDIFLHANDGDFNSKLAAALAPETKTIYVAYADQINYGGGYHSGQGYSTGQAMGGIVKTFAQGGFHKLTPMRTGIAQVVPPNTWRVVGDRIRDDEAYIPINRSTRSQAILTQTAERMGYALMRRYATGGIAAQSASAPAVAGGSLAGPLNISGAVTVNGLDGHIDGRIEAANHETGTRLNRRTR